MDIEFTPYDTSSWSRFQTYWYFSQMAPTGYSLTVDIEISDFHRRLKQDGIPFYPAYLWLITRNLAADNAFTTAVKDGVPGFYNFLTPLYALFHEDDRTFSLCWTDWEPSFSSFYENYRKDRELYSGVHGILSKPGLPPENAYTVSCLPWVDFRSFSVHTYENKPYYFPSLESGKITADAGREVMPLSITCHHAATDGWHIRTFLDSLEKDMAYAARNGIFSL